MQTKCTTIRHHLLSFICLISSRDNRPFPKCSRALFARFSSILLTWKAAAEATSASIKNLKAIILYYCFRLFGFKVDLPLWLLILPLPLLPHRMYASFFDRRQVQASVRVFQRAGAGLGRTRSTFCTAATKRGG